MKIVISHAGTIALRVSADDVVPKGGILSRQIIEFIAQRYQFSVKPNIPQNVPPMMVTHHVYQSGALMRDEGVIPIVQYAMVPNGDILTATNTDLANKALDDLLVALEENFGYRFSSAKQQRFYHSIVVAQFEPAIEKRIAAFGRIEDVLNKAIPRGESGKRFGIKRLAFGTGDPQQFFLPNTVEAVETADFMVERRNAESYSDNRYFCSGPFQTHELEKLLQAIENEFAI